MPEPKENPNEDLINMYEYAWRLFDRHASQRLTTFNFYLILIGGITAGVLSAIEYKYWLLEYFLYLSIPFLSVIFLILDRRTKFLLDCDKEAMIWLENKLNIDGIIDTKDEKGEPVPHPVKIMASRAYSENKLKNKKDKGLIDLLKYPFTFSQCFTLLFIVISIVALALYISRLSSFGIAVLAPTS